ncbi:hypothetical RHH DNA-binding protein [Alphaspiravirus yamagawaense]|uniref:Hypothetical RHH DNA-binding protein n=1 Tax=Alphaspiravirus yamagawaense TaxID=1157339 RepID=J7Q328_9VIRU|nr:hypothetical RHH DNA-binding protein [Aeropyrum coil-shaped virus]CCG27848.1 hypothetical RHH DNA-binding protein [Aeropyrum coil-shaped virus]
MHGVDVEKRISELLDEFQLFTPPFQQHIISIEEILPKTPICVMPEDMRRIVASARLGDRNIVLSTRRRIKFDTTITAKVDPAAKAFLDEMISLGIFENKSEAIRVAIYLLREVFEKAIQQKRAELDNFNNEGRI